ncbi:uncharacterized protein D2005.3 [Cimex lectularius]|uniref:Programmed cell death protein 5 n=1 Tax=Cimex lectularius TaxID=79782 RepID=A0A8I6S3F8_CIMLE|nr:uncharacterized protein D2005.3 [Cimex lectularius]
MGDRELESIRAKRLAEMSAGSQGYNPNNQKALEEKQREAEQRKNDVLSTVLSQFAQSRLNTLKAGKPEKGQMVEQLLVQMFERGQLMHKLDDEEFKNLLESISMQTQKETRIKFDRRRHAMDSDDDLELDV